MSSFVWMKVLESSPERYDHGIRMLSRGRIGDAYERGTGGAALACAARGAHVVGVDIDAGMLEVARAKPIPAGGSVVWIEAGVGEIEDHIAAGTLDAAVSCLAFSELSAEEQRYTLDVVRSRLVPGGTLVLADEVAPRSGLRRSLYHLRRLPRTAVTWLLTQTSTRPVGDLAALVTAAGFERVEQTRLWSDTFLIVSAARGAPT